MQTQEITTLIQSLTSVYNKDDLVAYVSRLALGLQVLKIGLEKTHEHLEPKVVQGIRELTDNTVGLQRMALKSLAAQSLVFDKRGAPENIIDGLYRLSIEIYNEARYEDAAAALLIVVLLDSSNAPHLMALGHAECRCGRFQAALIAYAMAALSERGNPESHLYSAYCYEKLKDYDNALNALDIALAMTDPTSEYSIRAKANKNRLLQLRR